MGGFAYGENTPEQKCPYCGGRCHAEYCDIGVGWQQVTPHVCEKCHAVEIGPYDEPRELTNAEKATNFYEPNHEADK